MARHRRTFKEYVSALFGRSYTQMNREIIPPSNSVHEVFKLRLGDLPVGVLSVRGGQWTFRYADEFRAQQKLRPLPIFPVVNKVYESNELWSFFRMRVPSLKQPSVRRIVDEQNIDSKDEVKLLKRFGRRTISNPFELVPESVPSETITTG
jgi:HipA-like protein